MYVKRVHLLWHMWNFVSAFRRNLQIKVITALFHAWPCFKRNSRILFAPVVWYNCIARLINLQKIYYHLWNKYSIIHRMQRSFIFLWFKTIHKRKNFNFIHMCVKTSSQCVLNYIIDGEKVRKYARRCKEMIVVLIYFRSFMGHIHCFEYSIRISICQIKQLTQIERYNEW